MDNHSCHISIDVIEMAKQHHILLLLLPPHCTHALQPLDSVTFSAAKSSWKRIVGKYFLKSHRKTIRKLDLPSLFNELYSSAFTPRQVVAGFTRTGIWPYDPTVMRDKVARQSLLQQLDQSSSTTSSANISVSSTQGFPASTDTNNPIASSILSSSSDSIDQDTTLMVLDFIDKFIEEANRISNESTSTDFTTKPTTTDNSILTTNSSSSFSSNATTDILRPLPINLNSNSPRAFSSTYDISRLCEDSSNGFDISLNKSSGFIASVDTKSTFEQYHQLTKTISNEFMCESDTSEEDDEQKIIGYNPSTLPTTRIKSSNCSNNVYQQQHMAVVDNKRENHFYISLTPVDVSNLAHPPDVVLIGPSNIDSSSAQCNQLSPSTAVRSIVSDLFRQHASHSSSPPKTNKRKRSEGIFGEEITSSNMLSELKEKASQQNPAKRTRRINTTKRKYGKTTTTELITSSQAMRAISTIQAPHSTIITSD